MKFIQQAQKNWFIILCVIAFTILLLSPNIKAYVLHAIMKVGFFKADTKKGNMQVPLPANVFFVSENGVKQNVESLKGKVVFINFWATWCPPCIAEMPTINALCNKLKSDNHFIFIMADVDNDLSKSLLFMKNNNYSLPVFTCQGELPVTVFNGTIPTTIIIDPKGDIIQKHEGITNYDTEEMIGFLRSLK